MKAALKRVVLIGMAAAMLALSIFQVAGAIGTHTGNSNGCAGWGLTYIISFGLQLHQDRRDVRQRLRELLFGGLLLGWLSVRSVWPGLGNWKCGPLRVVRGCGWLLWHGTGYHRFCSSGQSCTGGTWITTAP